MTWHDGQIPKQGDLTLRLISAGVLIPFGLYSVHTGGAVLAFGCALFAALMAYEWVRMSVSPNMTIMVSLAVVPTLALYGFGLPVGVSGLALAAIIAGLAHPLADKRWMQSFGLFYVAGMPFALFLLRDGPWNGAVTALIIMAIVWGSDSAAYFSGRGFGGPPLHPDSPSKTWSGAIGALIFSILCGALAARITGGDLVLWLFTGGIVSVLAQLGDLFESSLKRLYKIKDSSGLVPGHGGLLDRVDGLGFVCTFTVLIFMPAPSLINALGLS